MLNHIKDLIADDERDLEHFGNPKRLSMTYADMGSTFCSQLLFYYMFIGNKGPSPLYAALAEAAYINALKEDSTNLRARNDYAGLILKCEEDPIKALSYLEPLLPKVLGEDQDSALNEECERLQLRGIAYLLLGDEEQFLKHYKEACSDRFERISGISNCKLASIRWISVSVSDMAIETLRQMLNQAIENGRDFDYWLSQLDYLNDKFGGQGSAEHSD